MFEFNGDYGDRAQVEAYYPAYMKRYWELVAEGRYPYNDDFKGHIPGIEGDSEDTAIYLLQGMRSLDEDAVRMARYRADGFVEPGPCMERRRFDRVVVYRPNHYVGGRALISEFESARLGPGVGGVPAYVLKKGARVYGYGINDTDVVLVKGGPA